MTNSSVLIIEDEPNLAKIFSLVFASVDYQTEIAVDGKTALAQLPLFNPTVVVLDLHLPDLSGKKILQYLKNNEQYKDIHILIVTADLILARNLSAESALILLKPIDTKQLRDLALQLRSD